MPYAIKNEQGEIVALTATPNSKDDQPVSFNDPEVLKFLTSDIERTQNSKFNTLFLQDLQEIRIVEDLIDLLTAKGIILFSELPQAAQEKILRKKTQRDEFNHSNDILLTDETIMF